MLNTLANHGYIARDGLNISMDDLKVGLENSINLDPTATQTFGAAALLTSTTGNNATFNLDDLDQHKIIEHDGSLSRADFYFGDVNTFQPTIWETVLAFFTNTTIPVSVAKAARSARLAAAEDANAAFNLTTTEARSSAAESALYLVVMADPEVQGETVARTQWVRVLFEQERLPVEEGWVKSEVKLTSAPILAIAGQLLAA
ncbi:hypothetical protein QTJ16_004464 [Diplocarpon rosae]|uniref:Heme haloperoxidase family profile domain-containing protein n=1 Tax=Diplocarpon rosae TaxID=946125 RepID=A0AAD9SZ72_9HELO|nr:hypothetical protein QTJ16_004464 [Diplocarpon rosae]